MDKSSKIKRIFITGVLSHVITLIIGIILPKLIIVNFGSDVNGLLASVKQIFVYIALLEAGIGTAALQALYKPFAQKDVLEASKILLATDHYFKRTGILYSLAIGLLALFYPSIFHVNIPHLKVSLIILLLGAPNVIKFLFYGKLTILLRVDGRSYVTGNIAMISNILTHLVQILLIQCGFGILSVQLAYFIISLLQMTIITAYVRHNYKWIDYSCKPDYGALKSGKFVVIHQISALVFNNTDIIILSYFCGLKVVSVYTLYALIFNSLSNFIDATCSSFEFVLGQAFQANRQYFIKLQDTYETYYLALSFCMFTIALILIPSFIRLYTFNITDINYNDLYLPYLFCAINLLTYARRTSSQIINFAGHFKQTQWRSILESTINLTVSLICVKKIGIYGVLIGTIAALFYRTNDIIFYANKNILERWPIKTYRRWGQNLLIMLVMLVSCHSINNYIKNYGYWFLGAGLTSTICLISFFTFDSLCDIKSFRFALAIIKNRFLAIGQNSSDN